MYKSLNNFKSNYYSSYKKIYENGKIGFATDKAVVKPQFNKLGMAYGRFIFVTSNNGEGVVDDTGKIIVPSKYSKVSYNRDSDKDVRKFYGVKQGKNVDVYSIYGKFLYESTLD